jgi:hypothetical protein
MWAATTWNRSTTTLRPQPGRTCVCDHTHEGHQRDVAGRVRFPAGCGAMSVLWGGRFYLAASRDEHFLQRCRGRLRGDCRVSLAQNQEKSDSESLREEWKRVVHVGGLASTKREVPERAFHSIDVSRGVLGLPRAHAPVQVCKIGVRRFCRMVVDLAMMHRLKRCHGLRAEERPADQRGRGEKL